MSWWGGVGPKAGAEKTPGRQLWENKDMLTHALVCPSGDLCPLAPRLVASAGLSLSGNLCVTLQDLCLQAGGLTTCVTTHAYSVGPGLVPGHAPLQAC